MVEEKIQRFEYKLWFEGDRIPPKDIAKSIEGFIQSKNAIPLNASYGTIFVPREDVGQNDEGIELMESKTLEEFAIKFSDIMNTYAITGSMDAKEALDKVFLFWRDHVLPLMPFHTSKQFPRKTESC